LTRIGDDISGKKLLMRLVREFQAGITTDEEAIQIERIIRCSSPSHARMKEEAWVRSAAISAALTAGGATLQSITSGTGDYIYDEYSVVIDRMSTGLIPEAYLDEMAKDLNKAVNNPSFDSTNIFKRINGAGSRPPKVGDIYEINILGPDDGSVMLVEKTSSYFIFQTVSTTSIGTHPEYGSREFGFEKIKSGGILFYTRGASRPGSMLIGVVGKGLQTKTWASLVIGIGNEMTSRGGHHISSSIQGWTTHR
jgi:hypothetical protein